MAGAAGRGMSASPRVDGPGLSGSKPDQNEITFRIARIKPGLSRNKGTD
jgi:hypothetical protein